MYSRGPPQISCEFVRKNAHPIHLHSLEKNSVQSSECVHLLLGSSFTQFCGFSLLDRFCLGSAGLVLFLDLLHLCTFGLGLVDELDENTLVLVHVPFCLLVKGVVNVLVYLLLLAVLSEQTTQYSLTTNPQHLARHTSIPRTLPLTNPSVSSLALGQMILSHSCTRVYLLGLTHDKTILEQLPDGKTGVGHTYFLRLIWVEVDPILTAFFHRGSEPLLEAERHDLRR